MLKPQDDRGWPRLPVLPLPQAATGVGGLIQSGDVLLAGWSLAETSNVTACTAELYDGTDAKGTLLAVVNLSAGQCVNEALPEPGVLCRQGLFLNVISGSIRGSLWVRDV